MLRCPAVMFILVVACGCSRDGIAPAEGLPQEGAAFTNEAFITPFYGEQVVNGRLHLIGKRSTWVEFQKSREIPPTEMRTLIGKGPQVEGRRMTVVLQTLKDEPAMEQRLLETMRLRWRMP